MKRKWEDFIVTGIPRGGTTLITALFNSLTNCICLSEPVWQQKWPLETQNSAVFVDKLVQDFESIRKKISNKEPVQDRRSSDGSLVTNYYVRDDNGKIKKGYQFKSVIFQSENKHFFLGMKHNALYTSILPEIIRRNRFSVIAVLRHPIPTILSWNSVQINLGKYGRSVDAEPFWETLRQVGQSQDDLMVKQVKTYDLFCKRYLNFKDQIHLIKYEKLIEDPGILAKITGKSFKKKVVELQNLNHNRFYDTRLEERIRELLIKHASNARKIYSLDDY